MTAKEKLRKLCEIEGFIDEIALFESAVTDSACPGICMNPGCSYTTEVEPDQSKGYCENCGTQSVRSGLVLGGII